jgi:hypothetical protein
MVDNPLWEICEREAEVQTLLDDRINGGVHSAANVVARRKPCSQNPNCSGRCLMSATSRRTRRRRLYERRLRAKRTPPAGWRAG